MRCLWVLFVFLSLEARAEEFFRAEETVQPDYLAPVNDAQSDYHQRVSKHLIITDGDLGRFLVRPSFEPEYCVSIYANVSEEVEEKYRGKPAIPDREKRYFITLTQASESLWYSMVENSRNLKTRDVNVIRTDREISLELAVAIQRVWEKMIMMNTRYHWKSNFGDDGTTYIFSVNVRGIGEIRGETWSPQEGLPAEMVSLGANLVDLVSKKDAPEKPLLDRLRVFETKLSEP